MMQVSGLVMLTGIEREGVDGVMLGRQQEDPAVRIANGLFVWSWDS